jgi:hypothetical protein
MREWLLGLASGFWQWLHDEASQAQATFLGWVIGLVLLVGGALLNDYLNRRRDNRLREEDRRTVAAALRAELVGWSDSLQSETETMRDLELPLAGLSAEPSVAVFTARLLPDMVPKLGLLRPTTIKSVIAAYNAVENRYWELSKYGAELRSSSDFPSIKEFRASPDHVRHHSQQFTRVGVQALLIAAS